MSKVDVASTVWELGWPPTLTSRNPLYAHLSCWANAGDALQTHAARQITPAAFVFKFTTPLLFLVAEPTRRAQEFSERRTVKWR